MECPKCGYQQDGGAECRACGVIFAKLRAMEERPMAAAPARERPPAAEVGSSLRKPLLELLAVAAIVAIAVLLWMNRGEGSGSGEAPTPAEVEPFAFAELTEEELAGRRDLRLQLEAARPPGNAIERSRNATVLVKTPWGSGSGFFVSADCRLVTNRHVVQADQKRVEEARGVIDGAEKELDSVADEVERRLEILEERCVDCTDEQLEAIRAGADERLDEYYDELYEQESQLTDAELPDRLTVTLADGTEMDAEVLQMSREHDLALLKVSGAVCPTVATAPPEETRQGEQVFTIGSPMGLHNAVTSGVYSGLVNFEGRRWVQTDAPINPGNSGGPLVDTEGRVLGVNTMILLDSRGIGFAIPMATVEQEFKLTGS